MDVIFSERMTMVIGLTPVPNKAVLTPSLFGLRKRTPGKAINYKPKNIIQMKEIKFLDEKTVEIDGQTFARVDSAKEPEFKVGDWVIGINDYNPKFITRIVGLNGENARFDDADNQLEHDDINERFARHATPEEIESHLKKVAKEKGFVDNISFTGLRLWFNPRRAKFGGFERSNESIMYPTYDATEDTLNCFDKENEVFEAIYEKGKWAEIDPAKKPLPKTKEELISFVNIICEEVFDDEPSKIFMDEHLNNYED
jgi:hypothetical protein